MTRFVVLAGGVLGGLMLLFTVLAAAGASQAGACAAAASGPALPVSQAAGLNASQQTFVAVFAADTGLDAGVVAAWVLAEEGGHAVAPNGPANWLNIGSTDSVFLGGSNPAWQDPASAATASADWLRGTPAAGFGTASAGVQAILRTAGQPPAVQIAAIQQSGWATSGYPDLPGLYQQVTGQHFVALSVSAAGCGPPAGAGSVMAVYQAAQALSAKSLVYTRGVRTLLPLAQVPQGATMFDCSASDSEVLALGGFPLPGGVTVGQWAPVSGSFMPGAAGLLPGPGQEMTIYANAQHMFIELNIPGVGHFQANTANPYGGFRLYPWTAPVSGGWGGPSPGSSGAPAFTASHYPNT